MSPWTIHRGVETGDADHQAPAAATTRNENRTGRWSAKQTTGTARSAKNSSCRFSRA